MLMKVPSIEWSSDTFEQYIIEEESDNEFDNEFDPDFTEYLWMEDEEEFDKSELQRLEIEEIMEDCIDTMVDDEIAAHMNELQMSKNEELSVALSSLGLTEFDVENSRLNPLAAEFVPRFRV